MYQHFKNIEKLYGDASVRLPNGIFRQLSQAIKNRSGRTNIKQVSFAYGYLVTTAFLYKYAHYVDLDNGTYIQNNDIKELLGYDKTTKTIDRIIKKGGVLDELELTATTKEFPIEFYTDDEETINDIPLRIISTFDEMSPDHINYSKIKQIVKNRNYVVKEPLFLTAFYEESDYGTLYSIERTHQITIKEFLKFMFSDDLNNIDFFMYGYFKSKCKGFDLNMRSLALGVIFGEMGMNANTFYNHLQVLKDKRYVSVHHKGWKVDASDLSSNDYYWLGVK
ncbi:hypothetical protein [Priestia megaterium]|uniref:hypothetical protein n=1 Tax=Priestia megaterium TaxID=1404 RepID=UPI000BFC7D81|nr:hypothetical protein [Priestia megaterium]PGO60696.1 hypothetical protein CN981_09095 [Priestia megaterium]